MERKNWINVFILGFGFLLLFSAFQTTTFLQTLTLASFLSPDCQKNDSVHAFGILSVDLANKVGYYSGAIIYFMVAIGNWASISIVAVAGPKWSLVVSGFLYVVYIAALIRPLIYTVFLGAFILGAGGGVLWTAQGQILIQNSSKEKMGTTSGIFWLMLETSLVLGSIYVIVYFFINKGDPEKLQCFDQEQNMILFGVLTILAVVGVVVLFFIVPVEKKRVNEGNSVQEKESSDRSHLLSGTEFRGSSKAAIALKALVDALKMLKTRDMLLLSVVFIYTGYELNFWSGVYGTVIGRTLSLEKFNVGIALLCIGLGEIAGGGLFGVFGAYTNRWGREPIIFIGFLSHMMAYLLTYYFLPAEASLHPVEKMNSFGALIYFDVYSNAYVPAIGALLLGFGDACFNTQIYSIIGVLYSTDDQSAPAMALYKFFQSIAAMVGFFTSTLILLSYQLIVLVVLAVLATFCYAIVEWTNYVSHKRREEIFTASYEEPYVNSGSVSSIDDRKFDDTDDSNYY